MVRNVRPQQAPEGYKKSGVGIIPEDWDVLQLHTIAILERGKFSARPRNDPKFFGGNVPFIQTGDIARYNGVNVHYDRTLNEEGVKISKVFPKDTLFFTIAANIGDVAIVPFSVACPDSLIAIRNNPEINKFWLLQTLKYRKGEFESLATHNAQLNINLEKLNPYQLAVPPKTEQTAIANALSDVDALITSLEILIAKKRDIKTAAMQQLLTGKKRLPPFCTGEHLSDDDTDVKEQIDGCRPGYKKTDLGEIPEDWDVVELKDIAELTSSKRIFEDDYVPNGIPFYRGQEISQMLKGERPEVKCYISESKYSILKNKYGAPEKGDILITAVGTLGNSYFVDSELPFYFKDGNLIWLRKIKDRVNAVYLSKQLGWLKPKILEGAIGSSQKALTIEVLNKLQIPLPPYKEQVVIFDVLSTIDFEIRSLDKRLNKTKEIKYGMMQELLTGRTRLV
ncbi:restriction endonuclease subunit S [Arenicella sp. 4NH20-0111]|uniref:restriction endonuclease subunit S n=1 Tax=Arenicella sp. 4NH20-0111 TaxID=3127648 RepID=UPI0031061543